jgi:hypothetical protein
MAKECPEGRTGRPHSPTSSMRAPLWRQLDIQDVSDETLVTLQTFQIMLLHFIIVLRLILRVVVYM